MIRELEEKYGWIELGSLSGMVKGGTSSDIRSMEYGGVDLGTLEPGQEFHRALTNTIDVKKPAGLSKLFLLILGPDVIYFTDCFLEKIFSELSLMIRIGSIERKLELVHEGKVKKRDLLLMGEIRDWIIYFSKRWKSLPVNGIETVTVEMEISGKMGNPPKDMEFGIGIFSKIEG